MVTATIPLTSSLTCVKGDVKVTSIFDNAFDKRYRNSKALALVLAHQEVKSV